VAASARLSVGIAKAQSLLLHMKLGVRMQFQAPAVVTAWDCNCSVCNMKKNVHTIVPAGRFHVLKGEDELTVYRFGTMTAVHKFCRICGVQSFYHPRSNPEGIAVTVGSVSCVHLHQVLDSARAERSIGCISAGV